MPEHHLARLGWRADTEVPEAHEPARVVAVDRGRALVDTGAARWSAPLAGRLRVQPVVGDFVAVTGAGGPVRAVLPRRGVIARRVDRGRPQVMAANVDLALIATSLNRDLNPRRIARFIAVTVRGEVEPLVVLTKADLEPPPELDFGAEALAVSALTGAGIDALRARLEPARTAVLLGTSGVGKSTLVNALLGRESQATRPIRSGDDRGRHTTVRRELFSLPGGALLIDTPGLRAVAPIEDGEPLGQAIDKAALQRERKRRGREGSRALRRFYEERGG